MKRVPYIKRWYLSPVCAIGHANYAPMVSSVFLREEHAIEAAVQEAEDIVYNSMTLEERAELPDDAVNVYDLGFTVLKSEIKNHIDLEFKFEDVTYRWKLYEDTIKIAPWELEELNNEEYNFIKEN